MVNKSGLSQERVEITFWLAKESEKFESYTTKWMVQRFQ